MAPCDAPRAGDLRCATPAARPHHQTAPARGEGSVRVERIGLATLYHGDCRDILPSLGHIDAVVTDPPYGVKERTSRGTNGRGRGGDERLQGGIAQARDWRPVVGDNEPFDPSVLASYSKAVIFGGNHFGSRLPDASKWIVWDKREETTPDDNADCEMAWTNLKGPARIHRQLWRGICRRGEELTYMKGKRLHPTQKPVALMDFCLSQCRLPEGATVLDPYMGSAPVGVAAVRRGYSFIGVEIDPEYFDVACQRMEDEQRQPRLFATPHQHGAGNGEKHGG